MIFGLPLNFSILLKEQLTSMVYMVVEVVASNGIYDDGVKAGATSSVPHKKPLQMDFDVLLM